LSGHGCARVIGLLLSWILTGQPDGDQMSSATIQNG
jgi:hypothetical protein